MERTRVIDVTQNKTVHPKGQSDSRKITYIEYAVGCMLESIVTGETLLIMLAVLAGLAVVATALKYAVKIAIRVGIVAAVILGGVYAAGVVL